MFCPYCGEDKDPVLFTEDHVLPRALGGGLQPSNPFKLDACGPCNNAMGRYAEAPAVRNWLLRLRRPSVLFDPFASDAPPMLLQYIGRLDGWKDADTVCDYWLGPTGDSIFHFHRPYPGGDTMVGGMPGPNDERDPGVVFVGVVATNPAWHPVIVRSVAAEFEEAPIHYMHDPAPAGLERQRAWIEALGLNITARVSLPLRCGERISAKLALGVASIALGAAYQMSPDAALLRRFMRAPDPEARAAMKLHGHALLTLPARDAQLVKMFGWRGCHTITLLPMGDALACVAVLYGAHGVVVPITSEPTLWRPHIGDGGRAWVIAPGLRTFAGPSSVPAMLIDIASEEPSGPLAGLVQRLDSIPPRPPVHLESSATSEGV
jgi:hypothetical protein